ncbi:hypothetical protein E4U58_000854 [Claviceps cyperi]|nr:hypothetical protein E4U58_000854 [Claviceps cyperi]
MTDSPRYVATKRRKVQPDHIALLAQPPVPPAAADPLGSLEPLKMKVDVFYLQKPSHSDVPVGLYDLLIAGKEPRAVHGNADHNHVKAVPVDHPVNEKARGDNLRHVPPNRDHVPSPSNAAPKCPSAPAGLSPRLHHNQTPDLGNIDRNTKESVEGWIV